MPSPVQLAWASCAGDTLTRRAPAWVVILLSFHAALLAWGALRHSPTSVEARLLPSGISYWRFGRFDLYPVNPPLVPLVSSVPVLVARPETDWTRFWESPGARPEFAIAPRFAEANGERTFWLFTLARWACIPLMLLGGYLCYRWAGELHGPAAGLVALGLWCFSPNLLGHGQLISSDAAAASLGVCAAYLFWRWLRGPGWSATLAAGLALGAAELTKTTWIVLFLVWPLVWLVWRYSRRGELRWAGWLSQAGQIALILLIALHLINLGYAFEETGRRLGEYQFTSRALGGHDEKNPSLLVGGNRFADNSVGKVPIPLPKQYVRGIDMQKSDFERMQWSYLRGKWRQGGWWYYYLYGLGVKVPLGTWMLILVALAAGICLPGYAASWRDELVLLAPLVVVLTLVSSQTAMNHHLRYVLPISPFAFVWTSKVARAFELRHRKLAVLVAAALLWSVTSSLLVYPHNLSYFNELVAGPRGGPNHLLHSSVDWGQDLLYLKRWLAAHPEARPFHLALEPGVGIEPPIAGIRYTLPPLRPDARPGGGPEQHPVGPQPGWHALSVNTIHGKDGRYAYFRHFQPIAMAGYSVHIYRVTLEDANRVRRELGLEELPVMGGRASADGVSTHPLRIALPRAASPPAWLQAQASCP